MPHYRINIKLEQEPVREFVIEDFRKDIDMVYLDYRRRVYEKNGAGRVTYFDLVMIATESIKHLEDRKEVFHEKNDYGILPHKPIPKEDTKKRRNRFGEGTTLGERARKRGEG